MAGVLLPLPQLPADEGMRQELQHALASHGVGSSVLVNQPTDPLPALLLSAARLLCMSPPELYAHTPAAGAVGFVSPLNEWYALLECLTLLRAVPEGCTAHAVSSKLDLLCRVEPDVNPSPHPQAEAAEEMALALGCKLEGVRLADCPCWGGRGLASTRAIREGERVVSLPPSALLSAHAARQDPELMGALADVDEGEWTETIILMLLLLHERQRARASRWWRWLRLLPRVFDNTSSWSAAELRSLGRGATYWRASSAREELLAIHASLLPRLQQASPSLFPSHAYSPASWAWARAVVETRALSLPAALGQDLPAGAIVIAPWLDMANNSQAPQLRVASSEGMLCLEALVGVEANTELCISYGSLDAEEMVLHHGLLPALPPHGTGRSTPLARSHPPLRVPLELQPSEEQEAVNDGSLVASVMLMMHHLRLPLDGYICETASADSSFPEANASFPEANASFPEANASFPEATASRKASVLPSRLLGSARLMAISRESDLSDLAVARADEGPLSDANEAAALELLARVCEKAVDALESCEATKDTSGTPLEPTEDAATRTKRKRTTQRRLSVRQKLGHELAFRQRQLYMRALEEIRSRQHIIKRQSSP
ncbi:MAG: hypothetical protein SGPRY_004008 [Prymnesium sp.]